MLFHKGHMKNRPKIQLALHDTCTGCTACASVCPTGSISMKEDREGFLQPRIDTKTCIGCHKCEKICPVNLRNKGEWSLQGNEIQRGYAAKNTDLEERLRSSSGGISALLAHSVIQQGGVAVGVGFDEKWMPSYMIIDKEEYIYKIQGSKYAQAQIDISIFDKIKTYLKQGKIVLFTGLACQIEGLVSYLGVYYENLILVDLVCLGISSPGVWRDYLDTFTSNQTIRHINFKDKSLGWHRFSVRIETNKKVQSLTGDKDFFMQSFFRTISVRRSCFNCPRRTLERVADITLADCWGAYKKVPHMDDNKGLSAVIVHSRKGLAAFEAMHVEKEELKLCDIVEGNPNMIRDIEPDYKHRGAFHITRNHISKRLAFIAYCKYNNFFHFIKNTIKSLCEHAFK